MTKIEILNGDITKLKIDAIVNAANKSLLGGGGVDGAIHRAAGHKLLEECRTLNGCETGQAKITKGYNLPAKFVIHTVGPVWYGGNKNEREMLKSCYHTALTLAKENGVKTIAFPAISCGVYRFPLEEACAIATETVKDFISNDDSFEKIIFIDINEKIVDLLNLHIDILENVDALEYEEDEEILEHLKAIYDIIKKKCARCDNEYSCMGCCIEGLRGHIQNSLEIIGREDDEYFKDLLDFT